MIEIIIALIICCCCCCSVTAGLYTINSDLEKRGKNSSNNKSSNESFEIDGQVNKNENIKWYN